jgi:transcriptional regulator with XRE-family HTH domain
LTNVGTALYIQTILSTEDAPIVTFLREVMRRRKRFPSQLAADLSIGHATVSHWLSRKHIPSTKSCRKLSEYGGVPPENVLSIAGHLPRVTAAADLERTKFRNYAHRKYTDELAEDLITMIKDLVER